MLVSDVQHSDSVYIYMCVCIYICIHICIYIQTHAYICIYIQTHVYMYTYIHIYVYSFFRLFPLPASLVAQMLKNLPPMQEIWVWSLDWQDPLEKATHSSILAWRIPWTEKPGWSRSTSALMYSFSYLKPVCCCNYANFLDPNYQVPLLLTTSRYSSW